MPIKRPGKNGGTLITPEPGEVMNPKGRGKGTLNAKTVIKKWLETMAEGKNPITKETEQMPVLEKMTLAMITQALKGDVRAYNALLDRMEGRPRQKMELMGEGGGPVAIDNATPIDYTKLSESALTEILKARTQTKEVIASVKPKTKSRTTGASKTGQKKGN